MRFEYLLLFPVSHNLASAHLIQPRLQIRDPTGPRDTATALPPAPTSPAQILQKDAACQIVGQALHICASLSPSFTALDPTAQARCLCYSSTVWEPNVFDGAVESCADFASTAVPPAYGALANLENFCHVVGNLDTPVTMFTLASTDNDGGGGNEGGSLSSYVVLSSVSGASPAMTGDVGVSSTSTAVFTSSCTSGFESRSTSDFTTDISTSVNGGQGTTSSPSKTISRPDNTMTIGGSTEIPSSSVERKVFQEGEIIWLGFAISLVGFFL